MSEEKRGNVLRQDKMNGTWVVFAAGRANRPQQTKSGDEKVRLADLPETVDQCPFCLGNEDLLDGVCMVVPTKGDGNGDDGENYDCVRVVPNKYPAVEGVRQNASTRNLGPRGRSNRLSYSFLRAGTESDLFQEIKAVGFHEVVIESTRHNRHIATTPLESTKNLLMAFRERGKKHAQVDNVAHTCYFKNHGSTAGASLIHPHAQIVSTPVVPAKAARLHALALEYYLTHKENLYEKVIQEEMSIVTNTERRIVDVSENFISLVPYASENPYKIQILPLFGLDELEDEGVDPSDFTSLTDPLIEECAVMLKKSMLRLQILLDEPCFNLVIHSAPVKNRGRQAAYNASAFFKWHAELTPRIGVGAIGGFELGSGFWSNSHLPENDAAQLRSVELPPIV